MNESKKRYSNQLTRKKFGRPIKIFSIVKLYNFQESLESVKIFFFEKTFLQETSPVSRQTICIIFECENCWKNESKQ